MSVLASVFVLAGAAVALLAGLGMLRFRTPYARFHSAGKASPIAFVLAAIGASIELGWAGAALLAVASASLVLTLPVGVHLLFRAVHRTTPGDHLEVDELGPAEFPSLD
ncbi:MAG TPA: monovalent cation/H(+) antiporter subunit G [Acidimicrobiales bacterium]|nr:monovalent cation/H(+) antiporter subunit G [Acidimicrobiales bacterium]